MSASVGRSWWYWVTRVLGSDSAIGIHWWRCVDTVSIARGSSHGSESLGVSAWAGQGQSRRLSDHIGALMINNGGWVFAVSSVVTSGNLDGCVWVVLWLLSLTWGGGSFAWSGSSSAWSSSSLTWSGGSLAWSGSSLAWSSGSGARGGSVFVSVIVSVFGSRNGDNGQSSGNDGSETHFG